MSFPDTDLPLYVEAAFGADPTADPDVWTWTDLSDRLTNQPLTIRAGRSDGADDTSPSTCTLLLLNDDGALTPLHPTSEHYPHVVLNTPLRVRIDHDALNLPDTITDTFSTPAVDSWGPGDQGHLYTEAGNGGVVSFSDWQVAAGGGTQSVPAAGAYRISLMDGVDLTDVDQTITVTVAVTATGAPLEPANLIARAQDLNTYYLFRAELLTSNAVRVSIHHTGGSGQIGSNATVDGLTHTAGQALKVRGQVCGDTLRIKAWAAAGDEPDTWALEVTDTGITGSGGVGVRSGVATSNSNAKPVVFTYDNWSIVDLADAHRFEGFADSWQPTYLPAGGGDFHSAVQITASGVLRRLGQGASPLRSAISRYMAAVDPQPVAYWPLEDGPLVEAAAPKVGKYRLAAFVGTHPSGAVITRPQWGRGELGPWLPPTLAWEANKGLAALWARVDMPNFDDTWTIDHIYSSGTAAPHTTIDVNPSYLGGDLGWPQLLIEPEFGEIGVSLNSEPEVYTDAGHVFDGLPHHIRWTCSQSGADVSWAIRVDGVTLATGNTSGAMTLQAVERIGLVSQAGTGSPAAIGYVTVWDTAAAVADVADAALGHQTEPAADRIARLCEEEAVTVTVVGDPAESAPMGPQGLDPLLTQVAQCAAADGGYLSEHRFGVHYRTRADRYNQAAALTVDLSTYRVGRGDSPAVLAPTYDDQRVRNEWTVARTGGAAVTYIDADRTVRYDDSVELNIATDEALPDQAAWRVHVGTVNEMRYPNLPLDLAANPALVDAWAGLRLADRVDRTNPPDLYPPGDIRQVLEGYTETVAPRQWAVAASCSPYSPWVVGVLEDDVLGRADTDGSALFEDLTTSETAADVQVTAGAPWTVDDTQFPFDITVGGEQCTVTDIADYTWSFVAAGTANTANNADTTPGLPAGRAAGDLLLTLAGIGGSAGTPSAATGATKIWSYGGLALFARLATNTAADQPTVSYTGGSAGNDTISQTAAFRSTLGTFGDVNNLIVAQAVLDNQVAAANINYPELRIGRHLPNCVILYVGLRQDDWTSVTSPGTEIGEPDTTTGNDLGMVWARTIQTTPAHITAGSFTVTGGSGLSKAAVIALRMDVQAFTVTRAVNGVAKAQTAGTAVSLTHPMRAAL